jgi:hypothetical protein
MHTIEFIFPGSPIPWNNAMINIRGRLILSPEARGAKEQLASLLEERFKREPVPRWLLQAKTLHMKLHYYGDWFWVNPHPYYRNREHFKNSWFLQPAHEVCLLAASLGLDRLTPSFLHSLGILQLHQDVTWDHCLAAAQAPSKKGAGERVGALRSMFGKVREGSIELNLTWLQLALRKPEEHFERRTIDLSALDKMVQDAVFKAIGVDDSLVDHYDSIHRTQVLLPYAACVYVQVSSDA